MARRTTKRILFVAAVVVAGLGAVAALQRNTDSVPASDVGVAGPHYSPFVVQMSHPDLPFSQISFKDVGMMSVAPEDRSFVYETIAESVAEALATDAEQPMSSQVLYSEAAADPSHHFACGSNHIYVDLWQSSAERYGYSLWSGCGADDRFQWQEVDGEVEPLAREIAESLRAAVTRNCFRRRC